MRHALAYRTHRRIRLRRYYGSRRRLPVVAIIAIVVMAAVALLIDPGGQAPQVAEPVPVSATRQPFTKSLTLAGVVENAPATSLSGISPGSEIQWLIPNGAEVVEGDRLFRELGADGSVSLKELIKQHQLATARLQAAERSPLADDPGRQELLARANADLAQASTHLGEAIAYRDQVVGSARTALANARFSGTTEEIRAASDELRAAEAAAAVGVDGWQAEVNRIGVQVEELSAGASRPAGEAAERIATLKNEADELAARVRGAEAAGREVKAENDGVVEIFAAAVPVGEQPADRVVGEIQVPGFVFTAVVDGDLVDQLPEPVESATLRFEGRSERQACEMTVVVPAPAGRTLLRCVLAADQQFTEGQKGTLEIVVADLEDALVIPAGAVRTGSNPGGVVSVVAVDGTVEDREVQVGPSDGQWVVISGGLDEGDVVLNRRGTTIPEE